MAYTYRDLVQGSSEFASYETAGTVTIYAFLAILIVQLLIIFLSSNRGNCSYAAWHTLSYYTMIHWIPLINLNESSSLESFLSKLALIFKPFELPTFCSDDSIESPSYNRIQIKTTGFINNSKEMLLVYLFCLSCCISVIVLSKFWKDKEVFQRMKDEVKWNVIIRLHLIVFIDFITFSAIDINFYSGKSRCSTANLILSLFFILSGVAWIMFIPIAIKQKSDLVIEIHPGVAFRSISTLVEEFKDEVDNIKYQYYTLYLVFRFSLGLCLVFLHNTPAVQILMISGFQILMSTCYLVVYIALARPFKHVYEAVSVFLTELLSLILVLIIGVRSMDGISESFKNSATVVCIVIIWMNEAVICARFVFRLVYAQNPVITIEPSPSGNEVREVSFRAEACSDMKSDKSLENCGEGVHDVTEVNEKISGFYQYEPYNTELTEKGSGFGTILTKRSNRREENMARIDLFSARDHSDASRRNILDMSSNTFHNLAPVNPRMYLENEEEKANIKQFLNQLKGNGIRVGNKGLE